MQDKDILENLIRLLPYWHYKVERPIKQSSKHAQISYEAYYCLVSLKRKGAMSMSELAQSLKLSKQQATQIIDKLYRHDLVERSFDDRDRRVIRIQISERGSEFLLENQISGELLYEQMQLNLCEEDMMKLYEATSTLLEVLPKMK